MSELDWERRRFELEGLHRKVPRQDKCVCGSTMICYKGVWVCIIEIKELIKGYENEYNKTKRFRNY